MKKCTFLFRLVIGRFTPQTGMREGGSGGFSTFYPGFRFWSVLEEFVFSRERGI